MLGLESNDNLCTSRYFQHTINQPEADVTTNEGKARWSMNSSNGATYNIDCEGLQSDKRNSLPFSSGCYVSGIQPYKNAVQKLMEPEVCTSDVGQPPFKFRTAAGNSLSISSDALKRARSLLGDSDVGSFQNVVEADKSTLLVKYEKIIDDTYWNKENISFACLHQNADTKSHARKILPPGPTFNNRLKSSTPLSGTISGGVHLDKVKANDFLSEGNHHASRNMSHLQEPSKKILHLAPTFDDSVNLPGYHHSVGALVDISNNICTSYENLNGLGSEKKRSIRRSSISPFKRPRICRCVCLPL